MSNLDLTVWFRLDLDRVMYRALGVLVLGGTLGLCLRDFLSTAAAALALRKSRILSDAAGARWAASTEGSVNRAGGLPKHEWPADAYLADLSESSLLSTSAYACPGTQNKYTRLD